MTNIARIIIESQEMILECVRRGEKKKRISVDKKHDYVSCRLILNLNISTDYNELKLRQHAF